jgi:cellulose synthase/poly-beta-1,6-N-acetylglucosamine synthase-like glycosyltransferase
LTIWQVLLLGLYVPLSCMLAVYGIHRVSMLVGYLRHRRRDPVPAKPLDRLPSVLVQIPVYNERSVVERVLRAVERLDYPRELLRVQVLDDSTDETVAICARACSELRARGMDAVHIHRTARDGFKAGALANGLARDTSELVAIFDADFTPAPDFLRQTVPFFADARVGLVQARWEHLNLERNLLTRLQCFFLDGHFIIEHTYRHRTGRIFNFNGTAGVWRRACIDDAGGWSASSITEDTEISFRAHVRGWRFVYLRDVTCPAEVPADVDAYKSQQHRWAKGYTEILREHAGLIWRARLPLKAKVEATLMLSNHFAFLILGALTILHFPVVLLRGSFLPTPLQTFLEALNFALLLTAFAAFYGVSQYEAGRLTLKRVLLMPLAIGLGMALTVNSSRAVLEALFGLRTGFVRTPKEGDRPSRAYKAQAALGQAGVEIAFGLYLLASGVLLGFRGALLGTALTFIVAGGFLFLGMGTVQNHLGRRRAEVPDPTPLPEIAQA